MTRSIESQSLYELRNNTRSVLHQSSIFTTMRVYCLLTTPPRHSYHNCTMVIDTIRVGFPNAMVYVYQNTFPGEEILKRFRDWSISAQFHIVETTHFTWIESILTLNKDLDEPICFVDGDMSFWDEVENIDLPHILNGMFIPCHLSDYSHSFYFSRLHTCLLFIRSPKELFNQMQLANPRHDCHEQFKPYLIHSLIKPSYEYIGLKPVYYDSCAKLYHAIGGHAFPEEVLNRFDHLNSASFYDAMVNEFTTPESKSGFIQSHTLAETNPKGMKGLRKGQEIYYHERALSLHDYLYPNTT